MSSAELTSFSPLTESSATALPEPDDTLYEVVDGIRTEPKPMGAEETLVGNRLFGKIDPFVDQQELGWACSEMLFELAKGLQRRPDVAFVPYSRWKQRRVPSTAAWQVIPSLAVEVVSPANLANDLIDKIHEYFQHGFDLIWVVFPTQTQVCLCLYGR